MAKEKIRFIFVAVKNCSQKFFLDPFLLKFCTSEPNNFPLTVSQALWCSTVLTASKQINIPGAPQLSLQHDSPHLSTNIKLQSALSFSCRLSCCVEFHLATCLSQNGLASCTVLKPKHSVQWLILSFSALKKKHLVKATFFLLCLT